MTELPLNYNIEKYIKIIDKIDKSEKKYPRKTCENFSIRRYFVDNNNNIIINKNPENNFLGFTPTGERIYTQKKPAFYDEYLNKNNT